MKRINFALIGLTAFLGCFEVRALGQDILRPGGEQMGRNEERLASIKKAIGELARSGQAQDLASLDAQMQELSAAKEEDYDPVTRFEIWLMALEKLDECTDTTFDARDAPQKNLAPLSSSGKAYPSGISPSAIDDPEDRRRYEEAIRKNREKAGHYAFQMKLVALKAKWDANALAVVRSGFSKGDLPKLDKLVEKNLKEGKAKAEFKKALLKVFQAEGNEGQKRAP